MSGVKDATSGVRNGNCATYIGDRNAPLTTTMRLPRSGPGKA